MDSAPQPSAYDRVPAGIGNLAEMFQHAVTTRAQTIAMTHKRHGLWQNVSWRDYGNYARWTGLGLCALGLEPGQTAAILSESIPEWLWADYGIIGAAGVSVGIYPTSSARQVEYILTDSACRFVFVENEEQLDKVLERRAQLPLLAKVVVFDMTGLKRFADPLAMGYDELLELGRQREKAAPGLWAERTKIARGDDPAIFVYTSGTTGPPKGAKLSHANLLFQIDRWGDLAPMDAADDTLAFLPLCHMAERMMTGLRPLLYAGTVNFAESGDTVLENLQEISPTVFLAVPRIWEKLHALVAIQLQDATALQRWAYRTALGIGLKVADRRLAHKAVPAGLGLLHRIADFLVLRNTKRMIGLDRARLTGSGAAPVSPELMRWYVALNLPMFEVYGQTECAGVATFYRPQEYALGKVGRALAKTEVKLAPDGEILIRGPHVFLGYHGKPEKTAETIRAGWLHTGDVGTIDETGMLKITDRKSDIIITSAGKNITPSEIENKLKFSPYVNDAIVIGERRNYLTALVMIDQENVEKYALARRVPFTDFASLTRAEAVRDLIRAEIDKVNATLSNVERIRKFRLLDVLLSPEDEEMTPTLKLRRKFVNEKYKAEIEAMYGAG